LAVWLPGQVGKGGDQVEVDGVLDGVEEKIGGLLHLVAVVFGRIRVHFVRVEEELAC